MSVSSAEVVSPNGAISFDTPEMTVVAPPLLTATGPLEMSEIPAIRRPAGFTLTDPAGQAYGPFAFEDGAAVGAAAAPYLLELDHNDIFRLTDPRTHTTFGPFVATNGALVTIGHARLAFMRPPGSLRIHISHRAAIGTMPLVAAGEMTPALQNALYALRQALIDVANRLAVETATVTFEGLPTIISPWGYRQTPTARKSLRDRETARQAADLSARALLETFIRENLKLRLARDPDGGFLLNPAPSRTCVVCALWRVKDEDAITAAKSKTVVWWTSVVAEPRSDARLNLNETQASDWRGIFRLPPLRE